MIPQKRPGRLGTSIALPLLAAAIGCAGLGLPKAVTQEGISKQRKERAEEARQLIDRQRDLAEYEAAKARWVQQHDAQGCREGLEKLLARNPAHRDARLLMAHLLLGTGEAQGAYAHAKAALDASPNDAQTQYTMAMVMDAFGKTPDALSYYERAAKMDPRNEDYRAAYQAAREAAHQHLRNTHSASLVEFRKADSNSPPPTDPGSVPGSDENVLPAGYGASKTAVARADSTAGNNSAEFAAMSDDDPTLGLLHAGQADLANGNIDAARENFSRAIAANPDNPQIPISASVAALRANRTELAVELLNPAAKRFPKSAAVHRALGAAYYRLGDYQSSQVALRQALSLDNSSALSYLLLGCTLAKLGHTEAAEANLRQARALDPRYNISR